MPLTPQQRRKLTKLSNLSEKGNVAITEHLIELEDTLSEVVDKIESVDMSQMDMVQKVAESVLGNMKGLDGKDGVNGKDGVDGRNGVDGKDGRDGRDGRDGIDGLNGEDGEDGADGKDGKDAVVDYDELALVTIEGLKDTDDIPMSAVKDLNATIATLQNRTQLLNQIATQGQRSSSGLTVREIDGSPSVSNVTTIRFSNGSVVDNGGGTVTVTTGGTGTGYTIETPTGSVNGSNVTFTVTLEPVYIVADGITYFANAGYTYAALTVTMESAPVSYIRNFY